MNSRGPNFFIPLLTSILITLGAVFFWDGLFFLLIPQFFMYGMMFRGRELATLSFLFSIVLLLFLSPIIVATILLSYAGLGLIGGVLFRKGLSPFKTVMSLTLYYYGKMFFTMYILDSILGGFDFEAFVAMVMANQEKLFPQSGISPQEVAQVLYNSIGAIYFFISFGISVMIYVIFRLLAKFLLKRNLAPLSHYRIEGFSWGKFLLLSVGAYLLSKTLTFGDAWLNTMMLTIYIIFLFNGFVTLAYLVSKRSQSAVIGYVVGIVALVFVPLSPVLSILGFLDAGMNMRKLV